MKRGFFLYHQFNDISSGVERKIDAQISALSRYYDVTKISIAKEKKNVFKSILCRFPLGSWGAEYQGTIDKMKEEARNDDVAFIFFRGRAVDLRLLIFLKKMRKLFPNAKIFYELPTYPYDRELLSNRTMWPWYFKNLLYKNFIHKYVDNIVTYSRDECIFGIPTIQILNGIDFSRISDVDDYADTKNDESINILAVAQFQKAHGYERIINGLANYYSSGNMRNVQLHMVGDGDARTGYEQLVKKHKLQNHVTFYGKKNNDELLPFYKNADIALSAFAGYRQNVEISSSLKVREYLAYGIPIVSGMKEDVFEEGDCEFFLEFPNDSSTIDFTRIIDFYDELYKSRDAKALKNDIIEYAKKKIDINNTMQPVINALLPKESFL